MKRSIVTCTMVVGALVAALLPSSAFAICPRDQIMQHAVGGFFQNCPDANPVSGAAYAVNTTAAAPINTGTVDIVCEDGSPGAVSGQGSPCQPEAGVVGDGKVTVQFDWGGGGNFSGCPNPLLQNNVGRNVIQVVANDGSSVMVSVGFSPDLQQYPVDFAEVPTPEFTSVPLSCSKTNNGNLQITQLDTQLCVNMNAPKLYTDCDTGTWGTNGGPFGFTPTCDATGPHSTAGKLYKRDAPCTTTPDDTFMALGPNWALLGTPDATGHLCVPTPRPVDPSQCAFVAGSGNLVDSGTGLTVETLTAVDVPVKVAGANAPSAKAVDVRAAVAGGNIVVTYRTVSELDLAGFNILTDAKGGKARTRVNDVLIAGKGINGAGASYEVSLARGKFQGGKVLYVESVLKSGNSILSDPATF
jgi:hypothetical protein